MTDRRRRDDARGILAGSIRITSRLRVENGFTVSGGHNFSTTAEVTYEADEADLDVANEIAQEQLRAQLVRGREEGTRERDKRNTADGR